MSYDRNPPAPVRFTEDTVVPPEPMILVWPSLSWLCGYRDETCH